MSATVANPATENEPAETPATPAPAAAAAGSDAPAASLLDRAKAAFKSKPDLQAEVTRLTASASDFRSQLSEAQAEVQRLTEENAQLKKQETELTMLIETAEADSKTVTEAATEMVAATGIPAKDLPAQEAEEQSFEARFEAAKEAGPTALSKFMTENKAEVRRQLQAS